MAGFSFLMLCTAKGLTIKVSSTRVCYRPYTSYVSIIYPLDGSRACSDRGMPSTENEHFVDINTKLRIRNGKLEYKYHG